MCHVYVWRVSPRNVNNMPSFTHSIEMPELIYVYIEREGVSSDCYGHPFLVTPHVDLSNLDQIVRVCMKKMVRIKIVQRCHFHRKSKLAGCQLIAKGMGAVGEFDSGHRACMGH